MKIFIVIVNWKQKEITAGCLRSLRGIEGSGGGGESEEKNRPEVAIVVVDNASRDGSVEFLRENFPEIVVLEAKTNSGFTGGNNFGIKYGLKKKADYIFLLNNDTFVDKNFLRELVAMRESHPQTGILGPKIYFAPGHEFHYGRYKTAERGKVIWYAGGKIDWENMICSHRGVDEVDRGQYEKPEETEFVTGCAMMIEKKVFQKIGLLDERYFFSYEDNDFCQKTRRAGFKILYAPSAKIWHLNAGSSGSGGPTHQYFHTRNRLLFGFRYAPWRTKTALFRQSISMLFTSSPWQRRGIIDFYLQRLGKGSFSK